MRKTIVFCLLIFLNIAWANPNYWAVLPYPVDNSLGIDERVELKYQDQNGTRYIRKVRVFGLTKYLVIITNEEAVTIQARSTKIWIKESEFNIEKEIDIFEPRSIRKAYNRLLKILKKKKIELEPDEFYTLVYEVGIHDKTIRQINDLAYKTASCF